MTTMSVPEEEHIYAYRWLALAAILLPTLLISLNNYMIQIAVPVMQLELQMPFSQAQLIFLGYSIGLSIALVLGGKLGDLYGRKKILTIGLLLFTVMAIIGGMTSNSILLITTRVIQGLGAALIQPQILATIHVMFAKKDKHIAFGIYGAVLGVAFTIGLILGGLLITWDLFGGSWRTIFFFNVPFGLIVLLSLPIIPESKGEQASSIDWSGAILLMLSILLFIYPLSEVQTQGWHWRIVRILLLSLVFLLLFVGVEYRKHQQRKPTLIDVTIFVDRSFVIGICSVLAIYISMFAMFFILSYFLQYGLHYDAKQTSFVYIPLGSGYFLTSILAAKLVNKYGLTVLKLGAIIMSGCTFLLVLLLTMKESHIFDYYGLTLLFVYGLGLGMATTPLAHAILNKIPNHHVGTAAGLFNTVMYIANALAVAGISFIFSTWLGNALEVAQTADYIRAFSASLIAMSLLSVGAAIIFIVYLRQEKR